MLVVGRLSVVAVGRHDGDYSIVGFGLGTSAPPLNQEPGRLRSSERKENQNEGVRCETIKRVGSSARDGRWLIFGYFVLARLAVLYGTTSPRSTQQNGQTQSHCLHTHSVNSYLS